MRKNVKYLLIALLSISITSCKSVNPVESVSNQKESTSVSVESSYSEEVELPESSKRFVDAVNNIEFSLDCMDKINAAYNLYNQLDDDSWDFDEVLDAFELLVEMEAMLNDYSLASRFVQKVASISYLSSVSDYETLDLALTMYNNLSEKAKEFVDVEASYNKLNEIKSDIDAEISRNYHNDMLLKSADFLNKAKLIPALNVFVYDDIDYVEAALEAYNLLGEDYKAQDEISEAYQKVVAANEHYTQMLKDPSIYESILINVFLDDCSKLPSLEDLTLDHQGSLLKAEASYRELSDESKLDESVVTNNNILKALREKYQELYNQYLDEQHHQELLNKAASFISSVNALPEKENLVKADNTVVNGLLVDYSNLEKEVRDLVEVKTLNDKLLEYKAYIQANFEFPSLPMTLTSISLVGTTNPIVQIKADSSSFYNALKSLYEVSSATDLATKCNMYLYIYNDDIDSTNYIIKENVTEDVLAKGLKLLAPTTIIPYIQEASKTNQDIESGIYDIGIQFADITGDYLDSPIYRANLEIPYTFDSLYSEGGPEADGYTMISTTEEFLAITDDLSGKYRLANDISLAGIEWSNLGNFAGTLDGAGHYLTNITRDHGGDADFGIFLEITSTGVVCNLGLSGNVTVAGTYAGAIAVRNRGEISNCIINITIKNNDDPMGNETYSTDGCIGGIVTENFRTIKNVVVLSKINGTSTTWGNLDGGLAVGNYGTITDCYFLQSNVSNGAAIGNDQSALLDMAKTSSELKNVSLYSSWDKSVWYFVNGEYPSLIVK